MADPLDRLLAGKRALVTGGSRGLGRTFCRVFAEHGARVAFTYSKDEQGARLTLDAAGSSEGAVVSAHRASVLDTEATAQVVRELESAWGGIDVLVNNAGITQGRPAGDDPAPRRGHPQHRVARGRADDRGAGPLLREQGRAARNDAGDGQGGGALPDPRAMPGPRPARGRRREELARLPPRRLPEALRAGSRRNVRRGGAVRGLSGQRRQQLHERRDDRDGRGRVTARRASCLVFGGSGALGQVVCRTLAASGARVALTYRGGEAVARELAASLPNALALRAEMRSVADVESAVDRAAGAMGGVDAFVQCAGVGITVEGGGETVHHKMTQVDERAFDEMLAVNLKSTFFACRRVAEVMRAGGGGNIVLVGSIDGVKPVPAPVHYAASKAALGGMTQAMAKELGEHGIRVNVVAPGILEGGLSSVLPDGLRREYVKHCGFKRLGRFAEIASVIAWLALRNTYVTGRTILLDGAL
ncbi:MAG: SDR family NAD(P)-dependent oxidoreductase [Candidatus Wallbacteria bacterium]|nr:SDR family NAD(P)-dependent oxidoreductase [Candidatus Wallbacteria bacterium]